MSLRARTSVLDLWLKMVKWIKKVIVLSDWVSRVIRHMVDVVVLDSCLFIVYM